MAMAIGSNTGNAMVRKGIIYLPSLRGAQRRSNPDLPGSLLDCFASLAMTNPHALCRQVAAIQRQQPFPVPLGGIAVVDRPLREGKTVMRAGIDLDLGPGAVRLHRLLHFLDGFHRRVDVGLGAAE